MRSLAEDIRFTFRLVRKRPGMSLLVLAALVLGIGINSAIFSVVDATLLRPIPLNNPDQLLLLYTKSKQTTTFSVSYPEFQDWRSQSHSFQSMTAYEVLYFNLTGNGPPEHLKGLVVTSSYFTTLGLNPAMGRDFTMADELPGASRVAIISHGLWENRFGSDPNILGKTIVLDDQVYAVIGVLPPIQFSFASFWDVWVGVGPSLNEHMMSRETRYFYTFARLARSATRARAEGEMNAISARLAQEYPKSNKDMGMDIRSFVDSLTATTGKPLWLMQLAAGLILLLACVNVVTVFVSSAVERRKEFSIRVALGASRFILLRQLLVQSLIFAVIGAGVGLLAAKLCLVYLVDKFPTAVLRFQETTISSSVIWFTVLVATGTALVATILPGVYAARVNISNELKGEWTWSALSKYRWLSQGALIVFEVALAAGLSIVSGLLIKSYYETEKVKMGFNPHGVLSFQVILPDSRYKDDAAKSRFYDLLLQKLRAIPGVQSASASFTVPLDTATHWINLQVDSQSPHSADRPFIDDSSITPGYFAAMKIPILQGRDFTDADRAGSPPVAIVDSELASHMWPGQSALGKHLRVADITDNGPPWLEIVGVVGTIHYFGPERGVFRMQVYEPAYQASRSFMCFVVNSAVRSSSLRSPIESAVTSIDAELPLSSFKTLDEDFDRYEGSRKISFLLLSSFAAIGIILGMIGIYGVVSNSVARRRREIAIRIALGSSVRRSVLLVTKVSLFSTLVGIALGALLVAVMTKVLASFLYGVKPLDFGVYLLSIVIIAVLASIASLVSIGAVLRLNPQEILRE